MLFGKHALPGIHFAMFFLVIFSASAHSESLAEYQDCLNSGSKGLLKENNSRRICIRRLSQPVPKNVLSISANITIADDKKIFTRQKIQKQSRNDIDSGQFSYELKISNNSIDYILTGLVVRNHGLDDWNDPWVRKVLWIEPFEQYSTYVYGNHISGLFRLPNGDVFFGELNRYVDQFYIEEAYGLEIQ